METPDILVIGGGIIGCSLARELARTSRKVVIVEAGRAGAAASSAAAGLLAPTLATPPPPPLTELCHRSAGLYESWVNELRADGAGDFGYRRPGILTVWTDPKEAAQARQNVASTARPERPAEWLSAEDLRRLVPELTGQVCGATFYARDAQVSAHRLARQVARVAELAGVQIREHEPVVDIERQGERTMAVRTASARYAAGLVVLAAGAWTGELARRLGVHLPTRPVKGQLMQSNCRVPPLGMPLTAGEALFVPRPDGRLVLGVTVEEAGFDNRTTLGGLQTILAGTSALMPAVRELPLERAWAGLRPATPDEMPYMGPVPPLRNLWVSTGHFRKGILLAPICAKLVAESILASRLEPALESFRPDRDVGK
jgi:glycine oxidase